MWPVIRWGVLRLLLPLLLLVLFVWPAVAQDEVLVEQEIRYVSPGAGEVFLVWGVNGWQEPPPDWWPQGSEDEAGVVYTPMMRMSEGFVLTLPLPAGTVLDYGFLTRQLKDGTAVSVWEANGEEDFHTLVEAESPPIVVTTLFNFDTRGAVVPNTIRYTVAEAAQVNLVWGINEWQAVPEGQQPEGTAIIEGVMYSPMRREGSSFVITVYVPANSEINYDFQITAAADGAVTNVWDTNEGETYLITAVPQGFQHHAASQRIKEQLLAADIEVAVPPLVLTVLGLLFLFLLGVWWRGGLNQRGFTLGVILLIAAFLRFNHVMQPLIDGFSWRQASTAMMAENYYERNANIFYPEVNWTGPGPNYQGREFQTVTYLSSLLYRVVGQQDWVGRTITALFGVWGVFALYHLIRLVWDEYRALLGAAMMAVLPGSLFIDRSFLPDPAMVALVTTSVWFLLAYLQSARGWYLVGAAVVGAWGFASKLPGLIVGLPMLYAAWVVMRQRRSNWRKRLPLMVGMGIVGLLPVVAYYLWARHLSLSYPPYHFAGSGNWVWDAGLGSWWARRYFLPDLFQHFYLWLWTAPVMALLVVGVVWPPTGEVRWLFHVWLVAFGVYYLIGAQELVENPWNLHLLNPAAAALAGHAGISMMVRGQVVKWTPITAVMPILFLGVIMAMGQASLRWLYQAHAAEDYALGQALQAVAAEDELVVVIGSDLGDPIAVYYSGRRGWVYPPAQETRWDVLPEEDEVATALLADLQGRGADWLGIVAAQQPLLWQERPFIGDYIEQHYEFYARSDNYIIYYIP